MKSYVNKKQSKQLHKKTNTTKIQTGRIKTSKAARRCMSDETHAVSPKRTVFRKFTKPCALKLLNKTLYKLSQIFIVVSFPLKVSLHYITWINSNYTVRVWTMFTRPLQQRPPVALGGSRAHAAAALAAGTRGDWDSGSVLGVKAASHHLNINLTTNHLDLHNLSEFAAQAPPENTLLIYLHQTMSETSQKHTAVFGSVRPGLTVSAFWVIPHEVVEEERVTYVLWWPL